MPQFYPLSVTAIKKTTRDAVIVSLQPVREGEFRFTPGQYLTFRRDFEGSELRRAYSICAGSHEGLLQVGIKQVAGGTFSTWANSQMKVGDRLDATPPLGSFYAKTRAALPHILAFAAGSGITPILSIIKTELALQPNARVTLVYANRNPSTVMFREELEDLKNRYLSRLSIVHILSEGRQDIALFSGRIDAEKCAALFDHWIDLPSVTTAYICGPEGMMHSVAASLEAQGLEKAQIRMEFFALSHQSQGTQSGQAAEQPEAAATPEAGVQGRVVLGGATRSLVIPPNQSLLDAALAAGLDAPYSCKAGLCATCKAKVRAGDVKMLANYALEDEEVEAGFVLTCQCVLVSPKGVVWDYDQAGS